MPILTGNAAEVPGDYVPWLPFAPGTSPGEQSIKARNRLGGSAEARGRASGSSWSATPGCSWGSPTSTGCSRQVDGTTSYLLDGMSVVAQYAPDRTRQAWYTQSLARIDEVLSVVNAQGKFWYQSDALGSTYAMANGAGAVVARGGYDVFGASVAISGNVGQPFGFTGREHELDSGLVYARDRYLAPGIGAWTQADRFKPFEYGLESLPYLNHAYRYANGRPTLHTDPTGQVAPLAIAALVVFLALVLKHDDPGGFDEEGFEKASAITAVMSIAASPRAATLILGEGGCELAVMRAQYLTRVKALENTVTEMRAAGASSEAIARRVVVMRNELKVWARDLGSFWARKYAEVRNWWKYGDSVGPTADQLFNQYGSWEKVIEASMRTSRSINEWLGF